VTEVTLDVYQNRAANGPRPVGLPAVSETLLNRLAFQVRRAVTSSTFFADISEFQPVITSAYPHPMVSLRADSGWRADNHIAANWAHCKSNSKIQVVLAYVVFIPGQLNSVLARLKNTFGSKAPAKLALMIDMESGAGFAGPGNHSAEANQWVAAFAKWAGNSKKVIGYANGYDWRTNWPSRPSGMKMITASYGTTNPGTWGWQYAGGDPRWPSVSGFPRTCPPFGSYVDMNVIYKSISAIKVDLGLTATPTPTPKDWFEMATRKDLDAAIKAAIPDIANAVLNHPLKDADGKVTVGTVGQAIRDAREIAAQVRDLVKALTPPTPGV
jgi:hypothetical protein